MTRQEAQSRALQWLQSVPALWGAAVILAGAVGFALAVIALPGRVSALEAWKTTTAEPALVFLVCSRRAESRRLDPRPCEDVLRGVDELLRLPVVPR